jgi:fibronectin type 3 domain-containing protein
MRAKTKKHLKRVRDLMLRRRSAVRQVARSLPFAIESLERRVFLNGAITIAGTTTPITQPAGELGINLSGNDDFRTQALWLNVRKGFSPWMYPNSSNFLSSTDQTTTGYPLVNAYAVNFMAGYPDGNYTLQYNGTGTISFSGMGAIVPGSTSTTLVNGITTTTATVHIQADLGSNLTMTASNVSSTDPINNLYLMMPGYSPSTTQLFNPAALQRLTPFSTIRLMDALATNTSTVANWSDRTTPQDFAYTTNAGIAYEDAIALANATNSTLWFNVPVHATPAFMTDLANLMKYGSDASGNPYTSLQANPVYAPLNPGLKVDIEYANELWHDGFAADSYNITAAYANSALPGTNIPGVSPSVSSQWNTEFVLAGEQEVYQLRQIYNSFSAVYGAGLSSNVSFVFAGDVSSSDFTQASFDYMSSMSATWGAPSSWISAFAVPGYIGLSSTQDVSGLTLNQLFTDLNTYLTTTFAQTTAANVTFTQGYGIQLYSYEGGQNLIPDGVNASVKLAAETDPRMGQFYTDLLNQWYTQGGSLFLPYSYIDGSNSFGAWGLLENALETGAAKWDAVIQRIVPIGSDTLDSSVGYDDFLKLKAYWGATGATWQEGDFTGDGTVNSTDLTALNSNLNTGSLTSAQQSEISGFPANAGTGLMGTYYSDDNLQTPAISRIDPTIDFNWNSAAPDPSLNQSAFSAKWTGQIEAASTETYEFRTFSDDGVRVFINGQEIINDWNSGTHEDEGQISLVAGQKYSIEIDYFQNFGNAKIDFQWETPTMPWTDVPTTMLYPAALPATTTVSVSASTPAAVFTTGQTPTPGVFTLTRLGDPTAPLTVSYSLSGSAVSGTDYTSLSGNATFAAGASSTTVSVSPLADPSATIPETVTLTLTTGQSSTYQLGASASATIGISQILNLPAGWQENDIGFPSPAGFASFDGNAWSIDGGGSDIYNAFDQFSYVNTNATGDSTITATVDSQADTDPNAKSGVMFRDSTAAGGAFIDLQVSPNGVSLEWRSVDGQGAQVTSVLPTTTLPITLELDRQGNNFTAFYSLNGLSWTAVTQSPVVLTMPSTILAGLAVTSHNNGTPNLSTFTNVSVASGADVVSVAPTTPTASITPTLADGTYTFTRTGVLASALTVNYTLGGTAVEGTDYSLSSGDSTMTAGLTGGTITFAAGSPTATITLAPLDNIASSALLTLGTSTSYTLGTSSSATINIAGLASVTVVPTDASATQNSSPADTGLWTFTRTGPTTNALTVNFTLSGTATEGTDYSLSSADSTVTATTTGGTITFAAGSSTATLLLTPINPAATVVETASLTLASGSYAAGTTAAVSISVLPPVVAASVTLAPTDAAAVFGASPADNGLWTFTRTGPTTSALTVNFALSGTALEGTDYSLASADSALTDTTSGGTITFATGASSATLALTPLASGPGKTATLTLAAGSYTIGTVAGASIAMTAATSSSGSLADADIGSPAKAGSAVFNSSSGVWTQSGGGSDIWLTGDQFNFASTSLTGNATLLAEVTSLTATDPWAKAGLMFRDGAASNAANVAVVATPGNGVSFQWRSAAGAGSNYINVSNIPVPTPSAPVWLELTRNGNVFTASYSTNGATYIVIGSQTIVLSSSLLAGLAVSAHNNGLLATATFSNVAIPAGATVTSVPAVPVLAAASAAGTVNLSWSLVAGATTYDLYRSTTPGGEGTTPYVTGLGGTPYADIAVTAGTPYYYTLTSVNSAGQSSPSTEVTATPTASTSTGSLSDADIGTPAKTGSGSFNSSTGVWTIAGGGSDIWGNGDQFNLASTPVAGNTSLIAEVTSLTNTDPWAKAGLMLRDGSASNAANVAVVATPGNGVSFQWRTAAGASSNYMNLPNIPVPTPTAPVWLELTRSGNVFTASYSTNGTTYTVIGSQTIALNNSLLAGLAVTAHNNNLLATATFANVAIPASGGTVAIPAQPTIVATGAAGAVNLSWSPVSGATTYDLYRATVSGGEGTTPYLTGLTGTGYSDSAVTAGTPYYYTLTAVNSASQQGPQSTETTATPTASASTGSLSDADIGSPGKAGSASLSGGVWTVTGGGSDIWLAADQFNFASTTVSGNTTLIAEVTSLSGSDPWTKAGLMLRDGSASNAANVAVVATTGNGVSFQWRTAAGASSNYMNVGSIPAPTPSAPVWLELTRSGNVFTASYSTNGTTYTVIGSQTIALSNSLLAGLAVTAHNNSLLVTATFANVAIPASGGAVAIAAVPALGATGAAGAVNLSWSTVSGAATYNLYRSTTPGGEGTTPYLTGLTGTGYSDTAVTAGTPYYYTLTTVNSGGQSSQSTEASATPTAAASAPALSDADIGSPGKAGSASLTSGVWTVTGGGSDIWLNSDQFNFASGTVTGNATMTTEVTSLTGSDPWTKAGLMFRDGLTATAPNVALVATAGNGINFQYRPFNGASSANINLPAIPAPAGSAPLWLQLTRSGNVFTASYSTNGTTYTVIGSITIVLSNALSAGLAVTAHNNSLLATATFANTTL